jgi:hypothetical protein
MYSRWFSATVVVLWLATMSWLVKEKIWPLVSVGEPPSVNEIIAAQRDKPAVAWTVSLGGQQIGWALEETSLQRTGLTEVHGRVHFDTLPLEKLVPGLLQSVFRLMGGSPDKWAFDARSVLTVDSFGHQVRFDSTLRFDPCKEAITVHGTMERGQAELQVRMRSRPSEPVIIHLPSDALLSDAFAPQPQTELPGLRAGQKWTVPVYSPLWPDKNKWEILRAKVEGRQPLIWNGEGVSTWLVVYRSETATGAGDNEKPRGQLWVRCSDGAVLKQEAMPMPFGPTITFLRLPDEEAVKLVERAGRLWWDLDSELRSHD